MSAESVRNFYRKQGAESERQRILNLIEKDICTACKDDPGTYEHPFTGLCCRDAQGVIALINGEEY